MAGLGAEPCRAPVRGLDHGLYRQTATASASCPAAARVRNSGLWQLRLRRAVSVVVWALSPQHAGGLPVQIDRVVLGLASWRGG